MKVIFLCKRQYTGRDVINDRFGRLYEMPFQLAKLGHEVHVFCLDYHHKNNIGSWEHEASPGTLHWHSDAINKLKVFNLCTYPNRLLRKVRALNPDLIIGASDIPHVALAAYIAKKTGAPYIVDLYDNFESFGQARIPFFKRLLKNSIRNAGLTITVSSALKKLVEQSYQPLSPVVALGNGVDTQLFFKTNKLAARQQLNLPENAVLIGTAGSLYRSKGLELLYKAWDEIFTISPDIYLVLAGSVEASLPIPNSERVLYLGHLPYQQVPTLFSALDIGIVTLSDNNFGHFCFPQKAYEMAACELPFIATNIGVMSDLLGPDSPALYKAEDVSSLAKAAVWQLRELQPIQTEIQNWQQLIAELETHLMNAVAFKS